MKIKLDDLKFSNVLLREVKRSDYVSFYRVGSNPNMCKYLNWGPFKNIGEALYTLDNFYLNRPDNYNLPVGYSIIIDNDFRGIIDYHTQVDNSISIGYFLEESYWHKGYMNKILRHVIEYAFNNLDIDKINIQTLAENERNINLIKNLSFKYETEEMVEVDDNDYRLGYNYSLYKNEFGGIK